MTEVSVDYEVAVVGCGPVGATAANLLGQAGLRTVVIERQAELYPLPRAVHIDHEILRVFQSIKLADVLVPLMREAQGHIHIGADNGVIRYLGSAGLPKRYGWENDYFFFQPELEEVLRDGMRRFDHVTIWRETALVALEIVEEKVVLTIDRKDSEPRHITARYVIACDGANSFVRKTLGIPLVDLDFEEPWLVVDAEVEGSLRFPDFDGVPSGTDLRQLSIMLCDPKRPATLVPGRGNHRRWEFMLLPDENDDVMMQREHVEALIRPYLEGANYNLIRAATYRFHGLLADRWQQDRIFLAGDAAHQTPPFFGQGMCHGIRDVANLAWKLAAVLKTNACLDLLDTYQLERAPHVRAVIDAAISTGRYICERDPQKARERDEALRVQMGQTVSGSASELIPALLDGVVDREFHVTSGVGSRFIQPFVGFNDRRMLLDDVTGGGFVLIAASSKVLDGFTDECLALWERVGGRSFVIDGARDDSAFQDIDGEISLWLKRHDANVVILRPDFYVYGHGNDRSDVTRLISRLASWFHKNDR